MSELELSQEHLDRNDEVYNAVHECICRLTEQNVVWDVEMIEETTEAIKSAIMSKWGLQVRQYSIETDKDGNQTILSGLELYGDEEGQDV